MVIQDIKNKNEKMVRYIQLYIHIFNQHKFQNANTHTHTIYNIFCIYLYHPIEAVQLIYHNYHYNYGGVALFN